MDKPTRSNSNNREGDTLAKGTIDSTDQPNDNTEMSDDDSTEDLTENSSIASDDMDKWMEDLKRRISREHQRQAGRLNLVIERCEGESRKTYLDPDSTKESRQTDLDPDSHDPSSNVLGCSDVRRGSDRLWRR